MYGTFLFRYAEGQSSSKEENNVECCLLSTTYAIDIREKHHYNLREVRSKRFSLKLRISIYIYIMLCHDVLSNIYIKC